MNREDLIKITSNINKYSCPKNINFHCHTKFSDGSLEPYELLEQAYKNNLKFLSITDHHTIKACLLYTSPSPRDEQSSRMPSSA